MKINEKEIRSGVNTEVTVGTVSEYSIKVKECTRKVNVDGNEVTINSAWIGGKIVVDVNGTKIEHKLSYLDTIRHKKNGDENKSFASILTALGYDVAFNSTTKKLTYTENGRKLNPTINSSIVWEDINGAVVNKVEVRGSTAPDRISVKSQLNVTHSLNKDGDALNDYDELPVLFLSTKVEDEDKADFVVEGVITKVSKEYGADGQSETGRYLIDVAVVDFFGVEVLSFVMEDKWSQTIDGEEVEIHKEDFYGTEDSFCQLGDTVKLSGSIIGKTVGTVQKAETAKKAFGGGAKNIGKGGYTKIERVILAGSSVDDTYAVEDIQAGLEEREINLGKELTRQLEARKAKNANAPKNEAPVNNSPFKATATTAPAKANPFSNTAKNPFQR